MYLHYLGHYTSSCDHSVSIESQLVAILAKNIQVLAPKAVHLANMATKYDSRDNRWNCDDVLWSKKCNKKLFGENQPPK